MESLLLVLEWKAYEPMNITVSNPLTPSYPCYYNIVFQLVTRAVRVIDLITGLDMSAFHSHGGWNKMLDRLQQEVAYCAQEVPGLLPSQLRPAKQAEAEATNQRDVHRNEDSLSYYSEVPMETGAEELDKTLKDEGADVEGAGPKTARGIDGSGSLMCMPERAALIKSILNFLKKAIPEPTFAENIRTCRLTCDMHVTCM